MNQRLKDALARRNTDDPLRSYLWRVELDMMHDFSLDEVFEISSRVLSITTPYHAFGVEKAKHGNGFWYFANTVDLGQITLEVMEYGDGLTFEYFDMWRRLISNPDGTFNPPVRYKKNLKFYRLDTMKQDVSLDTYTGYFVSSISEIANDYEANGVVKYSITLTGDEVHREYINVPGIDREQFLSAINKAKSRKQKLTEFLF
jgi:hypothetical protein